MLSHSASPFLKPVSVSSQGRAGRREERGHSLLMHAHQEKPGFFSSQTSGFLSLYSIPCFYRFGGGGVFAYLVGQFSVCVFHVPVHMQRPGVEVGIYITLHYFKHLTFMFWLVDSLTNPGARWLARLSDQWAPGILPFAPPKAGSASPCYHALLFTCCLETRI